MNATKILGTVAAASGAALLILMLAAGASAAIGGVTGLSAAPGGGSYPMGMGPGMMGQGGMGPGMMNGWGGTATATSSAAIPGAPQVLVSASEFALSPAQIVLPAGAPVNLTLSNRGALPHDLTIPALGVRIVAAAGQSQTAGLRDLPAGTYPAYCGVPGHADAGMRATVVVR